MHNAISNASGFADAQRLSGAQRLLDKRDLCRPIDGTGGANANRVSVIAGRGAHNRYAPAQGKSLHAWR